MLENIEFCYITDILNFYEKNLICSKTQFILPVKLQGDVQNILKAMDYS